VEHRRRGPEQAPTGHELILRLADRFAPGGALHFGQGKWYPGEQLPRWALTLLWRKDGQPLVRDRAVFATGDAERPATAEDAERLGRAVAVRLGLDDDALLPAFEDPWHFLAEERRLPENLTPETNELDDPLARERLARVFERGLGQPTGYVLPVQRWNARAPDTKWITERWSTRSGKLFLIPGDSPVGYRLRLGTLPHIPPMAYPHVHPRDPFEMVGPLPPMASAQGHVAEDGTEVPAAPLEQMQIAQPYAGDRPVRTAMVFEARDGVLHAFMPPVETAEDYLELLTTVEAAARAQGQPVIIEGYLPPRDPRIGMIQVTPDRLGTEKFMLDGRHTGTGGGNHVVLGGADAGGQPVPAPARPAAQPGGLLAAPPVAVLPLLRPVHRPHQPGAARRRGAPRQLYELEIALPAAPEPPCRGIAPWLVDRLFRNLLVDVTGNTHRRDLHRQAVLAGQPTGRLGLVELRAFEMPPHARMSLAQQLLLRALVARFWRHPYRRGLVRWGTALHDRFMLPTSSGATCRTCSMS
jgi:uncharacterized protein (DUF2126 family)